MTTDPTSASLPQAPGAQASQRTGLSLPAGEREKVGELAREFESFFILQMVRQMRQSMLDDEHGEGLGADTMTDTMDVELGRQMANSGGIGLAQVLQTAMERQVAGGSQSAKAHATQGGAARLEPRPTQEGPRPTPEAAAPTPVAQGSSLAGMTLVAQGSSLASGSSLAGAAVPLPVSAPVSSPFGWRADPFHGATRFHAGIDIAAAYGREVPSAGAGEVVFAGEQGGYGNTVVIEHAGGVRTRYAHLSSLQVEAGQQVDSGTVVGRVGTSGRSTGPHLHFEVLQDGRPVDPAVAAARYAGQLKFGGAVAD